MSILSKLQEGKLISHRFEAGDSVCFFRAMVGNKAQYPAVCPPSICPVWLAALLPMLADYGTECGESERWRDVAFRIGTLEPLFANMPEDVSRRLHLKAMITLLRYAPHQEFTDISIMLLERTLRGEAAEEVGNSVPPQVKAALKGRGSVSGLWISMLMDVPYYYWDADSVVEQMVRTLENELCKSPDTSCPSQEMSNPVMC